jgi:hypothetical protein
MDSGMPTGVNIDAGDAATPVVGFDDVKVY